MKRDLGLSASEVKARWSAEAKARNSAAALRMDRAGMWFDGRLFVAVTTDAEAARVTAAGAVPHRVGMSVAELRRIAGRVGQIAADSNSVIRWGVDAKSGTVSVAVTKEASGKLRQRLRDVSGSVRLEETSTRYRQHGGDVVGGEYWKPGSEGNCSIGFSATSGSTRHFLTAGHCTNDANQAAYGKDNTRLGTSNVGGNHSVNAREGDFGLVDVTEDTWKLTNKVSGWGEGDVSVTGADEPVTGMSTCHSGGNTKFQCGKVTQVNQTIDYGNVVIEGLFITDACSGGGDSGGSYITGPKDNAKAVGLHSGGGNGCGSSDPTTIGQPVNEALTKWSLTLVTDGPPPGDEVKVTSPGNQTSQTGTPVNVKLTASGGSTPYSWTATGLPAGLSIDSSTGAISGTPGTVGSSNVTVTATDSKSKSGSASFSWTITDQAPGNLTLANPGYQNAYVGRPVSLQMKATGGSGSYTWKATGLPAGLSISASGLILGTPTRWGLANSSVTVTDSKNKSAPVSFGWSVWNP